MNRDSVRDWLFAAIVAVLLGCGSADGDPAQRVEKPVTVETQR